MIVKDPMPPLLTKALICTDDASGCIFSGTHVCTGPCRLMAHTPEIFPRATS